jgi:ribosome maturation factor RimP
MSEAYDEKEVAKEIQNIINEEGYRFYDMHYNKVSQILRVFIDRANGDITVSDCKKVSNSIRKKIADTDLLLGEFALEVSSPGVERSLKRPEHYEWAKGKLIELDIGTKKIRGYIRDIKKKGVVIASEHSEDLIPYASIEKAKVVEEIQYGKRR